MTKRAIEIRDKINTAVLLGCFLWIFDTSLNLFARSFSNDLLWLKLLGLFLFSIIFPFWVSRRMFQIGVWSNTPHEPADRIWVALLAATIQLLLEFVGLQIFSPGKLTATAAYAVVCSFGALSSYKRLKVNLAGSKNKPADDAAELGERRRRIWIVSLILGVCGEAAHLALRRKGGLETRQSLYILLFLSVAAAGAYFFCFLHGRCPNCGALLDRRDKTGACEKCGLGATD